MPASTTTTTRAVKAAETRLRILDSARRVLAAEGVERFTTRRVAELARVSHGMVHYHFKDKRDLMLALVVHARRDWVEPLEELVDGPGTAEERMRAVIAWMARPATTEVMRDRRSGERCGDTISAAPPMLSQSSSISTSGSTRATTSA